MIIQGTASQSQFDPSMLFAVAFDGGQGAYGRMTTWSAIQAVVCIRSRRPEMSGMRDGR